MSTAFHASCTLQVALHDTTVDLKRLAVALGYGKTILRLAPADVLWECLHVVQGHVSPLALPTITAPAKAQVCVCCLVARGAALRTVNAVASHGSVCQRFRSRLPVHPV